MIIMVSAEGFRAELQNVVDTELSRMPLLKRLGFGRFMPIVIEVVSNQGSVFLAILGDGNVQLRTNVSARIDITIYASFETLIDLIRSRAEVKFIQAEKEGRIRIIVHTPKGQKLKEFLGY